MLQTVTSHTRQLLASDPNFKRLLTNSGWLLSGDSLTLVFNFLQGILVARLLGPEQFGILALITAYTTAVNQLVDSRVWETVIKFVTRYLEAKDFVRATAVVKLCYLVDALTGSLAFLILYFSAAVGARLFLQNEQQAYLIELYAAMMLIMIPNGTTSALLRVNDRFNWLAYQRVGVAILKLIGTIVLFWFGGGVQEVLLIYMAATAIGIVSLMVMAHHISHQLHLVTWFQAPLHLLKGELSPVLEFLLMTNAGAFFKLLQRNADMLLIGYWLSPAAAGYFRLARSFTDVMGFPINPIYTASYPDFTRLWSQQRVIELKRLVRKLLVLTCTVMFVILLLMWVSAPWLIDFTVGVEYRPALPVLHWLALGTALAAATNLGHPLLLAAGRVSSSLLAISLGVIVQLGLLVYLLPTSGIVGAGVAYIGFYLIWIVIVMGTIVSIFHGNDKQVESS
ncbi:MAG TPA: oligosaccharide flippase family protein [Anaerolineae bacterium]|nr:oligosaccharide flippase family protein [Anaerolineae bacterium]